METLTSNPLNHKMDNSILIVAICIGKSIKMKGILAIGLYANLVYADVHDSSVAYKDYVY